MPAPTKLTLDLIVAEALAILRSEGLDEVTLRKLAARLGVEAPSLYRHIGDKRRLQALMTLRLFRQQLDEVGEHDTWQGWMASFGQVLWTTQSKIRDTARLVLTSGFRSDELDQMANWVAAALAPHGVRAQDALEMQLAVQALVVGLSGLAEGPNKDIPHRAVPFDAVLDHTLGALIVGWETRLEKASQAL